MHRASSHAIAISLLVGSACILMAQSSAPRQHAIPVPSTTAVRRNGPIVLDGKLDEPAWRTAAVVTEFTQFDPDEGKRPSQRTEVRILDADGWTAELRIPLSQLRYSSDSVQTWGLQIRRWIQRRNEEDDWAFWRKNENGGPSRFGHLEGLRIARSAKHLELLPYVVEKST